MQWYWWGNALILEIQCARYWLSGWLTGWLPVWLIDRPTDQPTDRPTDRPTDWMTDWLTDCLPGCLTDWLADWPTLWLTDGLSDWLTDGRTDWLTDWLTEWLTIKPRTYLICKYFCSPFITNRTSSELRIVHFLASVPWQTHVTIPLNVWTSLLGTVVEGVQTGTAVMLLQVWA